ncbi:hypothetical protein [Terrisporobacter glycolicus]|uniref:hypothetical protein n=1 Tax=Terrisporobacter glycolicus TaxID=36841 RepID=UPI00346482F7
MGELSKTPRIIFYGAEQKKIVNRIDEIQYLDLHYGGNKNMSTARLDLFLFAMALGMDTVPTEIKQPDTFIRDEYVKIKHDAFFYAAYIHNLNDKNDLDSIVNKDQIYKLAQNYANTGFNLIGDMMQNKSESVAELEIIKELDEEFEKYFGND